MWPRTWRFVCTFTQSVVLILCFFTCRRIQMYIQIWFNHYFPFFLSLQSLSMLLNGTPFAFVIDLAALASRREYLKLDKWLTDKIREHGVGPGVSFSLKHTCWIWNCGLTRSAFCFQEPFIQACVTFLKRRCPSIIGGLAPDKDQPKSAQLPPETLATMLACLQSCAGWDIGLFLLQWK